MLNLINPRFIQKITILLSISIGNFVFAADLSALYPMLQTGTSDQEVQINVLVPRLKSYRFFATPVGGGARIEAKFIGDAIQDPAKLLHEKVLKIRFEGLKENTEYTLEMNEVFRNNLTLVDTRHFRTTTKESGTLKIASASCMSDEFRYQEAAGKVWNRTLDQKPDVVVLLGDVTYVDSFDYVERGKATPLDIWLRYFRSFDRNPLTHSRSLVTTLATWDDHDTGVDNGNETTPTIGEARRAFLALYGSESIDNFVEKTPTGVQTIAKMRGQNLVVLDSRSFRAPHTVNSRYAHFGKEQEEWFFKRLNTLSGPVHLFKGDMWGSPTIFVEASNGRAPRRITESFYGDHSANFEAFMPRLFASKKDFMLYSGDIHFSEVVLYGPQFKGSSYGAPFETLEVTSSPVSSIIFYPAEGEEEFWPRDNRVAAARDYNTVLVEATPSKNNAAGFHVSVQSFGGSEKPLFTTERLIHCEASLTQ